METSKKSHSYSDFCNAFDKEETIVNIAEILAKTGKQEDIPYLNLFYDAKKPNYTPSCQIKTAIEEIEARA